MPTGDAIAGLPPTCSVKDWVVFGPGFHKNENYSPAMVARVPQNFASGIIPEATAKVGHDKQQRFANSLGFPNVGKITKCEPAGNGCFKIDVENVPRTVGEHINAGWLNSGSVELLPRMPNPKDPSKMIEGPILTGVSFLGEEQPAVKGLTKPHATFADGSDVPPAKDPSEWFNAMAKVTRDMAAESDAQAGVEVGGHWYSATVIAFSEMSEVSQMTPEEENTAKMAACKKAGFAAGMKKFADSPDPKMKAMAATFGGGGAPISGANQDAQHRASKAYYDSDYPWDKDKEYSAAFAEMKAFGESMADAPGGIPPPVPAPAAAPPPMDPGAGAGGAMGGDYMSAIKMAAEDPTCDPKLKGIAMACMAGMEDMKKRVGAVEAENTEKKQKEGEMMAATFSAKVEEAIKKMSGRVEPFEIEKTIKPRLMDILTVQKFSAESDRFAEFEAVVNHYARKPIQKALLGVPTPGAPLGPDGKPVPRPVGIIPPANTDQRQLAAKGGYLDKERPALAAKLRGEQVPA